MLNANVTRSCFGGNIEAEGVYQTEGRERRGISYISDTIKFNIFGPWMLQKTDYINSQWECKYVSIHVPAGQQRLQIIASLKANPVLL